MTTVITMIPPVSTACILVHRRQQRPGPTLGPQSNFRPDVLFLQVDDGLIHFFILGSRLKLPSQSRDSRGWHG